MKQGIGILIGIIILAGGWFLYSNSNRQNTEHEENFDADMSNESVLSDDLKKALEIQPNIGNFTHFGSIYNVAGGSAQGIAKARYADGVYELVVLFSGLSEPNEGYFYEGWVVRRGDEMEVVSTGRVEEEAPGYLNLYSSDENLLEYDFYMLTLEPDDDDPVPSERILEGMLAPL